MLKRANVWVEPSGEGEGVLWISSDRDDRRIFWGLKFSIPGFFWVEKFGKYLFGWLEKVGIFGGIQNKLKICGSAWVSRPRCHSTKCYC